MQVRNLFQNSLSKEMEKVLERSLEEIKAHTVEEDIL